MVDRAKVPAWRPKCYPQQDVDDDNKVQKEIWVCADGKQRLSNIRLLVYTPLSL